MFKSSPELRGASAPLFLYKYNMDENRAKTLYAIPCSYGDPYEEGIFFTTFSTTDEEEALRLASCVHGKKGQRALCIISENGDIYHI